MSLIPVANANKYHTGAYEIFGYFTLEDEVYMVFRNSVYNVEQNPAKNTLKDTVFAQAEYPKENLKVTRIANTINALGYVPILSCFTGFLNIKRSVTYSCDPKTTKGYYRSSLVKGIFQMLGLGIVFLPTDTWISIQRKRHPADLTDLFNRTKHIESGEIPNLDFLRDIKHWSSHSNKESGLNL